MNIVIKKPNATFMPEFCRKLDILNNIFVIDGNSAFASSNVMANCGITCVKIIFKTIIVTIKRKKG
jgi:hypothetical protein